MHITLQSKEEGNYFWNMNQIDISFHGILIRMPCPCGTNLPNASVIIYELYPNIQIIFLWIHKFKFSVKVTSVSLKFEPQIKCNCDL